MPYLLIVAVLLLYTVLAKARAAYNLSYDFGIPYDFKTSGSRLQFIQPVTLTNRSTATLNIQSVYMTFTTPSGISIGTASLSGKRQVPPNSVYTLPIVVDSGLARLLSAGPELRRQIQAGELTVQYEGQVSAEGVTLPIFRTIYNYKLPNIFNLLSNG